jgi:hypothetical protein
MQRDPKNWMEPDTFHGFRHVDAERFAALQANDFKSPEPEKASPLTDVTKWQTWGTGRMAW